MWVALVAPDQPSRLTPGAFVRLPLEGLVVIALALVLPATARRLLACVVGPVLGLLVIVKILDMGFFETFDRPFDPVADWSYTGIGIETLRDSIGRTEANLVVAGAAVLGVAVLVLTTLAVLRLTRVAAGHRRWSLRAVTALGVVWVLCWAFGAQLVSDAPIASTSAAGLVVHEVRAVQAGVQDHAIFADEIRHDRFRDTPGDQLLTGLRGKDVLARVRRELRQGRGPGLLVLATGRRRARQGDQAAAGRRLLLPQRLPHLVDVRRHQLAGALHPAVGGLGRQPAALRPARRDRPPHAQPGVQAGRVADRRRRAVEQPGLAARGRRSTTTTSSTTGATSAIAARSSRTRPCPTSTSSRPCSASSSRSADRRPLFAEVDLVSSHTPWTRIPQLIDWSDVGDGSIFKRMPVDQVTRAALFGDPERVRAAYGQSIEYTLNALVSFVQHYGDDNLVLVVLGDHQPAKIVSGRDPSHDVPISVIAHDPAVLDRIAGWGWEDGLRPGPQAPVWRMSAFRDRFLSAFGS